VCCAPGDNLAIHAAVAAARPGVALAVSFAGDSARGYWGEVLTIAAQVAGVAGLVIDSEVRDLDAIERHRFPVFARGAALRGATKAGPGALDVPVALGGAVVRPGDWLVGDADGVVVIAQQDVPRCRAAGAARLAKEQEFFARLWAGATTVELLSLDVSSIENA
jgi:4-hydroxy-4-methyl-2-oxoglutarate aldolase